MSASTWLRQIHRRLLSSRPAPTRQRRKQQNSPSRLTVRPRLEALEDRITPTVFTPTTFADDGTAGSLRQAVINANNDNGTAMDTIQLSAGTYTLTIINIGGDHDVSSSQGDLNITNTNHALVILGTTDANGNPTSVIDQTVADRVIQIVNPGTTVTFKNLILEGGNAQDDGGAGAPAGESTAQGGGILDDGGNVTLSNVVVQSNQATAGTTNFAQGGGIFVQDGALTINHSVIRNNTATGGVGGGGTTGGDANGGGVCYILTGINTPQLSVTNSTLANNTAQGGLGDNVMGTDGGEGDGGGLYTIGDDTTAITGSTFSGNAAVGGSGGGGGGAVDGDGNGGGAFLHASNTVVNSTLALNTARGSDAAGGGVYFAPNATGQLTNVTVSGNQANLSGTAGTAEGGGLDNNNGDVGEVTLTNTLVAGNSVNTSAGSPQSPDVRGEFTSGGHNLIGIADGVNDPGFNGPGDLAGSLANPLNANLGPLQNNGGPTQTMLPLPGSPALGAADPSLAPGTDQRGQSRPTGGPTDIGAVQVSGTPTSPPPAPSPSSSPPPSLFQAILGLYIAEVEKDLHFGNPTALQQTIDFDAQYTVIFGINIAPLIEAIADSNVQAALSGGNS